jgi:hypothetical protein
LLKISGGGDGGIVVVMVMVRLCTVLNCRSQQGLRGFGSSREFHRSVPTVTAA